MSIYLVDAGQSIEAMRRGEGALGSAVAISAPEALTNCHVVAKQSIVAISDGAELPQLMRADISRGHAETDRCVLRVDGLLKPIDSVRAAHDIAVGERVYSIGNPSGLTKTLGEGVVYGLRKSRGLFYVQTTAPFSPGSSGGALVESRGALVSITTFILKQTQNLNFAIAAEEFWKQ